MVIGPFHAGQWPSPSEPAGEPSAREHDAEWWPDWTGEWDDPESLNVLGKGGKGGEGAVRYR